MRVLIRNLNTILKRFKLHLICVVIFTFLISHTYLGRIQGIQKQNVVDAMSIPNQPTNQKQTEASTPSSESSENLQTSQQASTDIKEKFSVKTEKNPQTDGSSVLNIKPLVNLTAQLLGIDTRMPAVGQSVDPKDPALFLKSLFHVWSPEASNWASRVSKQFKQYMKEQTREVKHRKPGERRMQEVPMQNCNCSRNIQVNLPRVGTVSDNTCSRDSFLRGPGQRVIGFSFYGDPNSKKSKHRKYFQGIKENLDLVPSLYPGWIIRVYYDLDQGDPVLEDLCSVACSNPSLDVCYARNLPSADDISNVFAMIWRFFPVLDPQVDVYVSRDLDSRLNPREVEAVKEWLASSAHFHFMRDHPAHSIEILGSGWGVNLGESIMVRQMMFEAFEQAAKDPLFWARRTSYGPDQGFLKRYIWPWGKWSAKSHDAYTCQRFPRTSPFPTRREVAENNFVASVVEAKDILRKECPVACRPKNHKEWLLC